MVKYEQNFEEDVYYDQFEYIYVFAMINLSEKKKEFGKGVRVP